MWRCTASGQVLVGRAKEDELDDQSKHHHGPVSLHEDVSVQLQMTSLAFAESAVHLQKSSVVPALIPIRTVGCIVPTTCIEGRRIHRSSESHVID